MLATMVGACGGGHPTNRATASSEPARVTSSAGLPTGSRRLRQLLEQPVSAYLGGGRLAVQVLAGTVWFTRPDGRANLNYCADPRTGQPLVATAPLAGNSTLLTADTSDLFYTDLPVNAHAAALERAPGLIRV